MSTSSSGDGEAQLQQRDEALAPGEDLRLAAPGVEQGDGLVERTRGLVAEAGRVDGSLLGVRPPWSGCSCRSARRGLGCRGGRLWIGHGDRKGLVAGVGPPLLMGWPRSLHGLPGHLQVVDQLRPGPDRGALAGLRSVLDQLVQPRIAPDCDRSTRLPPAYPLVRRDGARPRREPAGMVAGRSRGRDVLWSTRPSPGRLRGFRRGSVATPATMSRRFAHGSVTRGVLRSRGDACSGSTRGPAARGRLLGSRWRRPW